MNSSFNPFLFYDPREDENQLPDFPPPADFNVDDTVLTFPLDYSYNNISRSTDSEAGDDNKNFIMPVISSKLLDNLRFSGFSHEDGDKFLSDFECYLTLSSVDQCSPRAVAAFQLHLNGPARVWFESLGPSDKQQWLVLKAKFKDEYCNSTFHNPVLIAESVAFDRLTLLPSQAIEDFHAIVHEKGKKLSKSDGDMINKFVSGLPPQLAFFVRAGRISSFREALQSAKIGEAHGYRNTMLTNQGHTETPIVNAVQNLKTSGQSLEHSTVKIEKQLQEITQRLDNLQSNNSVIQDVQLNKRPTQSKTSPTVRTCYKCHGEGHMQRNCKWNGQGSRSATVKCQLCQQMGHTAPTCISLTTARTPEPCQLCGTSGHAAGACPTLNQSGLGMARTSQA